MSALNAVGIGEKGKVFFFFEVRGLESAHYQWFEEGEILEVYCGITWKSK